MGKKFKPQFEIVLESLEQAGYNNYWQVLNAKDYGVPQNRERVFIVSIRKDIDTGLFQFTQGFPLELRLKDMLDVEVDEKFYLSNEMTDKLVSKETTGEVREVGYIKKSENGKKHQSNTVYDPNSIGRTLMAGDYKCPLLIKEATKKGYAEAVEGDSINFEQPNSKTRRGRVGKQVAQTLTTSPQQGVVVNE